MVSLFLIFITGAKASVWDVFLAEYIEMDTIPTRIMKMAKAKKNHECKNAGRCNPRPVKREIKVTYERINEKIIYG